MRQVYELANAVAKAQKDLDLHPLAPCQDEQEHCEDWARKGECEKNPTYMSVSCRAACKHCLKPVELAARETPQTTVSSIQNESGNITQAE